MAAAALALLFCGAPALAETRALIAGVWQFQDKDIPQLKGPENDVASMDALIHGLGATDVTVLRNADVTRTRFETALHALGLRSKPGDWIFVYYSGHGSTADAAVKGTADGDVDQFLPLAGFQHLNPTDADTYIVDKDLYNWVARYIPASVQIMMVVDSCHSGTMHRSIDLKKARFTRRVADFRGENGEFRLAARPAPRFPAVLAGQGEVPSGTLSRPELANEIFIGGAQDDQSALEEPLPTPAAPSQGLLTYALAHGLTELGPDGKTRLADLDRDGKITVGELYQYVKTQVNAITEGQQDPSGHYSSAADRMPLFEAASPPPPRPIAPATLPLVYVGGSDMGVTGGAFRLAANADRADFVWDRVAGTVTYRTGDVVAQGVRSDVALNGVVEKWSALAAMRPYLSDSAARLTIGPAGAGARYKAEDQVAVGLALKPGAGVRYATVFNLASNGTVQRLYPLDGDGAGEVAAGASLPLLATRVVAPFGADHIVALLTPTPPGDLRDVLRTIDGQQAAARLPEPIRRALAQGGPDASLSMAALYTAAP